MSGFDLSVEGKVALVTGGAGGLGRVAAETFAAAGYRVLVTDIDGDAGEAAAAEIRGQGGEALFATADVADSPEVERAVAMAVESWGRLDFVLNNAGIAGRGRPIEELEEEELDRVLAVDLKGPFHVCKHAVPALKKGGGGSILNVASITGKTGSAYYTAYSAAKAGVVALTRGLARNLGRFNIRVNCLSPGSLSGTRLMDGYRQGLSQAERQRQTLSLMQHIPLGRLGSPRDVAHVALFLASPLAAHIHGAVLTIDGGESLGYH